MDHLFRRDNKDKGQLEQPLLESNQGREGSHSGMWWRWKGETSESKVDLPKGETSESKVDLPKLKSDLLKSIRSASESFVKVQKILKHDFHYPEHAWLSEFHLSEFYEQERKEDKKNFSSRNLEDIAKKYECLNMVPYEHRLWITKNYLKQKYVMSNLRKCFLKLEKDIDNFNSKMSNILDMKRICLLMREDNSLENEKHKLLLVVNLIKALPSPVPKPALLFPDKGSASSKEEINARTDQLSKEQIQEIHFQRFKVFVQYKDVFGKEENKSYFLDLKNFLEKWK